STFSGPRRKQSRRPQHLDLVLERIGQGLHEESALRISLKRLFHLGDRGIDNAQVSVHDAECGRVELRTTAVHDRLEAGDLELDGRRWTSDEGRGTRNRCQVSRATWRR